MDKTPNPPQLGNPSLILRQDIAPGAIGPHQLAITTTSAKGDLYYADGYGNFSRLALGTTNQFLLVIAGIPTWTTFPRTGTAANRPASGRFTGDQYFATDTFAFSVWTGAAWKATTLS